MLSITDVEKIGKLAKFTLTPHELVKFQKLLSEALDYVEVLNELDTNAVSVSEHASDLKNVFRDDVVEESTLTLDSSLTLRMTKEPLGMTTEERGMTTEERGMTKGNSGMTNGGKYFVTDAVLEKNK